MARNRFFDRLYENYADTKYCIFISHKKEDRLIAKSIADYLINAGIDVYFDEYDSSIDVDNPQSVVNAIKRGIKSSTHMLCLVTQNSLKSKWMPWEVGYGYDRTKILSILSKTLRKQELPEFLLVRNIINLEGITSLNTWISNILDVSKERLLNESKIDFENYSNPLAKILKVNV